MKEKDFHKLTDEEKNALVAEAIGLVPCDKWKVVSVGAAGGHILMSDGCPHELGQCYSTVTTGNIHGTIGGAPNYLSDMNLCMELVKVYARFHLTKRSEHSLLLKWRCDIRDKETHLTIGGDADTPQEAIIIACLKAEGVID
jgi:hypothetical protein